MKMRLLCVLGLLCALGLTACGGGAAVTPPPTATPGATLAPEEPTVAPEPTPTPDPIAQRLAAMTLEEKVGQLFVVGFEGTEVGADVTASLTELKAGGVILFGRNVAGAGQLTALTNALKAQNPSDIPLFLSVDQEGGMVERMPPEMKRLPNPYDLNSAPGEYGGAERMGQALGAQCAAFGFNVDFAPSFDVWTNPKNTVIGKRAYSSDPQVAADAATLCALQIQQQGVIPVAKHFPGHGDTDVDSHVGLPVVTKSLEDWMQAELVPFLRGIEMGLDAVMVSHIVLNALDDTYPATLSQPVVTGFLREELGFDGVIFTDDMTMGAITEHYGLGEACVLALEAGCDVVLVCHKQEDIQAAYDAVLEAARSGRLEVDEHVYRVLALKARYALTDAAVEPADVEALNALVKAVREA